MKSHEQKLILHSSVYELLMVKGEGGEGRVSVIAVTCGENHLLYCVYGSDDIH